MDGYSDGVQKRLRTERHWTKYPPVIGIVLMVFSAFMIGKTGFEIKWKFILYICIGALLVRKSFFDYGWVVGRFKRPKMFIGDSEATDKIFQWLGLEEVEKKFPVLTIIYAVFAFIGTCLMLSSFRL